ncbi:MAG: Na+/H+ antiporter subunit E [Candidatus Binatia bacterium]
MKRIYLPPDNMVIWRTCQLSFPYFFSLKTLIPLTKFDHIYNIPGFFLFGEIKTVQALSKFLFLMAFWLLLSGQTDLSDSGDRYLIICGVISCAFVTYIAMRKKILDEEGHPIHLTFRMLWYLPWLLWQIVLANLDVAYRVWHPKRIITPQIIKIPLSLRTSLGTMIYANSITLTPGTITVSVDEAKGEMLVHALSDKAAKELLSGEMQKRIKKLEGTA